MQCHLETWVVSVHFDPDVVKDTGEPVSFSLSQRLWTRSTVGPTAFRLAELLDDLRFGLIGVAGVKATRVFHPADGLRQVGWNALSEPIFDFRRDSSSQSPCGAAVFSTGRH